MDSEDALRAEAEKEKKRLQAEAEQRLRQGIEETKKIEQANAKIQINKIRSECEAQLNVLDSQMKDLQAQIQSLQKDLKTKELVIQGKDEDIAQRNGRIQELTDEIDRMRKAAASGDLNAAELTRQLQEAQQKLKEALEKIANLEKTMQ